MRLRLARCVGGALEWVPGEVGCKRLGTLIAPGGCERAARMGE